MTGAEQREALNKKEHAINLFKVLFSIVQAVKQDIGLVLWALAMINGILEDRKSNVKHMTFMQKSNNQDNHLNIINIIYNFIIQNNGEKQALDLAIIIEAQLIEAVEFKNCSDDAKKFLR
jgi:hypothetical protein